MHFIVLLYISLIKPLIPSNPLNNRRGRNFFLRVTINHRPLYAYEISTFNILCSSGIMRGDQPTIRQCGLQGFEANPKNANDFDRSFSDHSENYIYTNYFYLRIILRPNLATIEAKSYLLDNFLRFYPFSVVFV